MKLWQNRLLKRPFAATVWREGDWYVSKAIHTWSDTRTPEDVKQKRKRSSYETKFTATR